MAWAAETAAERRRDGAAAPHNNVVADAAGWNPAGCAVATRARPPRSSLPGLSRLIAAIAKQQPAGCRRPTWLDAPWPPTRRHRRLAAWRHAGALRYAWMRGPGETVELEVRGVVVGLFRENCWVVGSRRRGEACVIDPGDQPDEILALARDMGVRITRVVASHAHLDHIMAVRAIVEATGAPFLLHASDLSLAEQLPVAAREWLGQEVPPAPRPDAFAVDGQDLEIAGVTVRVIHTPGHTPGSVCLYAADARLLFSGDTLFRESIGRTDLPGGDSRQIVHSIARRLFSLPEATRVLPGHMQETTIGHERRRNPFVGAAPEAGLG